MARIKMTPQTYKGLRVKLLVNLTNKPPFDNEIIAKAGDVVEVQRTTGRFHTVKVKGSFLPVAVKIEDTKIAY